MSITSSHVDSSSRTLSTLVIAHRGACGYLPEHTLPSKALAFGQHADYIEQDVVLSRDNIPIVIHDIYLDEISNIASAYPGRNRSDGRFYAIDFTAKEITSLRATERFNRHTGQSVYPHRFPLNQSAFHLVTLSEELEFIAGLNSQAIKRDRTSVGIYVEIKDPAFHKRENHGNISEIVLDLLRTYNYTKHDDNIFLQCFDIDELRRIRVELRSNLKLVGLLTTNEYRSEFSHIDYTYWTSSVGIEAMSKFVDGIGPHYTQLFVHGTTFEPAALFHYARKHHLFIHPYTFRSDLDSQPFATFDRMLAFFIEQLQVDGIFIDQPDQAVQYLQMRNERNNDGMKLHDLSWHILLLLVTIIRLS
jgi:glycerophosphoryl diester phosphodiesterase